MQSIGDRLRFIGGSFMRGLDRVTAFREHPLSQTAELVGGVLVPSFGLTVLARFLLHSEPLSLVFIFVATAFVLTTGEGAFQEWRENAAARHGESIDPEVLSALSALRNDRRMTPRGEVSLADVFWEMRDYLIRGVTLPDFWFYYARETPWKKDSVAVSVVNDLVVHEVAQTGERTTTRFGEDHHEIIYRVTPLGVRVLKLLRRESSKLGAQ